MSVWSQCLLQERARIKMELLSLFHDYSLSIILIILVFVGGISFSMLTNSFVSDYLIGIFIEMV